MDFIQSLLDNNINNNNNNKFYSPYRLAFAIVWHPLSSDFAFTLPFHGFYSIITRQQQQQQRSSPYRLALATVRFRLHVPL